MGIIANVQNGELIYDYTDNSKKNGLNPTGSTLGYDQFLQLLCAEMQNQDPLEPTTNTEYVAQMATFSQLEATLSMGEIQKNNMANSLVGKQVILKITSETTGDVSYVDGKVDYIMYQDGEVYLSVNDGLYPLDTLDTVADSAYFDAIAVNASFENMINQLPYLENLTIDWKKGLEQIRELYDGMSTYEQGFVSEEYLAVLSAYEIKMSEIVKTEDAKAKIALEEFEGMLNELPELSELTAEDRAAVEEIRTYYNETMTAYQKTFVSEESLDSLVAYEDRLYEIAKEDSSETEGSESTDVV